MMRENNNTLTAKMKVSMTRTAKTKVTMKENNNSKDESVSDKNKG